MTTRTEYPADRSALSRRGSPRRRGSAWRLREYLAARSAGFALGEAIVLAECDFDQAARLPDLPPAGALAPLLHCAGDIARRDYRQFGAAIRDAGHPGLVVQLALMASRHLRSGTPPHMCFAAGRYEQLRAWLDELRAYARGAGRKELPAE